MRRLSGPFAACLVSLFSTTVLSSSAHSVPVLQNGSFEEGAIPPGTFEAGSAGLFWSASDVNLLANNRFNLSTSYGNQYIGMNTGEGGTTQQIVPGFLAGEEYMLDLSFAASSGPNTALSVTLSGAATGVSVFTAPDSAPLGGPPGVGPVVPIPFQRAEVPFATIADGSVKFLLSNIGGSGLLVDNVSLNRVSDAGTGGLLLGLGLLSLVCFRRAMTLHC